MTDSAEAALKGSSNTAGGEEIGSLKDTPSYKSRERG